MEWIPVHKPFAIPQAPSTPVVKAPNGPKLGLNDVKPSPEANPWPPKPQVQTGSQPQSQPPKPENRPPAQAIIKEEPPRQEVKRTPEPPQPPPSVQKFVAKVEAQAAKREAVLEKTEDKRRLAEEKAIAKEEKKIAKIEKDEEKRAARQQAATQKNLI